MTATATTTRPQADVLVAAGNPLVVSLASAIRHIHAITADIGHTEGRLAATMRIVARAQQHGRTAPASAASAVKHRDQLECLREDRSAYRREAAELIRKLGTSDPSAASRWHCALTEALGRANR